MRRLLFVTLCLAGLGIAVALFLASRRRGELAGHPTGIGDEPADAPRETEFSVAAPPGGEEPSGDADTAVMDAVVDDDEPVSEPPEPEHPAEPAFEAPAHERPEIVSAAAEPPAGDDLPRPAPRFVSPRDDVRRELRAELEMLPRQPLFERANACGVPTSRTILMSREELIAAIEEMELRSRLTGSSA
jgi:hypothetical protein